MKAALAVALCVIGVAFAAMAAAFFSGAGLTELPARPAAMLDKGTFDPRLPLFF